MSRVLDVLDRGKALHARKGLWLPLWQELNDVLFQGQRGSFTAPLIPGQDTVEIFDTTPMQARRGLASAIGGLLKPSTARWFWMKAQNDALNDNDDAKLWFDHVRDRMWAAIYDPLARFTQHGNAVDNDLAAFGLGYLWMSENRNKNGLAFRSLHLADCAIDENADSQVDTIDIVRRFTARQSVQRFGIDKVPPKVKEALEQGDKAKDHLFEYHQQIYPRDDYDPRRKDNMNMVFCNIIVSPHDECIVEESGFQEFPVAVPRWEVAPNEIYARSAGMIALPDSRTLQAMGHTLLVGGQRAVDPPIWVADDGILSAVRTFPGGLTVVDAEIVKMTGGKPMGHLESGANMPIGREMQKDYRDLVQAAFFKNVFNLPIQSGMTATEVMQRKEEFLREMGPTLGQLENDYPGAIVRRVFGIMMRANQFDPPPDILFNQPAQFEFMSPIQQAKRQLEASGMAQAMGYMAPIIQLQPDIADNFDGDEIARDIPDTFALPHKYIRAKDKVTAMRQAKQQAQQGQAALQGAQGVADVAHTVAQAGLKGQQGAQLAPPAGQ